MINPLTKNKSAAFRPGTLTVVFHTVLGIARWLIEFFTPLTDTDQVDAGIYVGNKNIPE
jgi:hypothetical protein